MTDSAGPALVGRETELAVLRHRLAQAGERGPRVVLVTGPSGAGSTALVRRLAAEHVAAGGRCLQAGAVPWEQDVTHGVLSQLVGRAVTATDVLSAAAAVVQHVAAAPGEPPALLVVDDASWSDPESLQALSTAVRHHPRAPILVVLAVSTDRPDPTPSVAQTLGRIEDRIDLGPLRVAELQRLAAGAGVVLGSALAERLRRFTGGRPGPVLALLAQVPGERWSEPHADLPVPAAVAADVRHRLRSLSGPAVALVEAVAVVGRAPLKVAAWVAGAHDPLPAVDELVTAGLVTAPGVHGSTEVADPMTSAAILENLGSARAAALHRAAADVVEDPVARLLHLVSASALPDPRLADELEALAAQRATTGEWAAVAELLTNSARLTMEVSLREDRLVRAFDALVGSGDTMSATARVAEIESLRETALRNAALGYLAILRGRRAEAESRLERAWDLVSPDRDPETAALICQRHVLHHLVRCRGSEVVHWADRALALVAVDSPVAIEAAAIRGLGLAATGRTEAALKGQLRMAESVGHGAQAQRVAMGHGWLHLMFDDVDEARAALGSATSTGFMGGSTRISLWAHAWLARAHFVSGEWDEALSVADRGTLLAQRTGVRPVQPLMAWTRAQVHALRGDWTRAEAAVREADSGPHDYEMMRVSSCLARAGLAEARGDYAGVLRAVSPLREPWAGGPIDEPGSWPWADVCANALVLEGRLDEADAFLRPHEQRAAARDHRSARARLGSARGRLLGARGDLSAARSAFEEAAGLLVDLTLPYDRARVHFAWGQTLRRAGKRREADVVLQTARDLYESLGATTYVERCDRELRAGGVRPDGPPAADRAPGTLTPQEELVAELVARGMTNRAVASELFVSTKTVQYHLTRIYAKLGIRSRGELAALRGAAPGEPGPGEPGPG